MPRKSNIDKKPLTKKAFERLLRKAAQPLPKRTPSPKETKTKVAHPSGDYSEKHKNPSKIGDAEVSQND